MKLLLDTHVIVWSVADPERLPADMLNKLKEPSNELWYSPISAWEILLLAEKGRLSLKGDPKNGVKKLFRMLPFKEAVLNYEVAVQSRYLDLLHADPADRFIAATAVVYGLILVTADKRLAVSKDFSVLAIG